MTVLIDKGPPKRYQSIAGVGSSQEDRDKADRLDQVVQKRIQKLCKDLKKGSLMPKKSGKGSVETYWNVGKALRDVAGSGNLLHKSELPLLFIAAKKMYMPSELRYKERGPYREHLWYCYRLAYYPKSPVSKMNWGEWVTVFDSTGINQEERFDKWFRGKLQRTRKRVSREQIRLFAPCVNEMLGRVDTHDLTEEELFPCYDAAWLTVAKWQAKRAEDGEYSAGRKEIQKSIRSILGTLDEVMAERLKPEDYAQKIIDLSASA